MKDARLALQMALVGALLVLAPAAIHALDKNLLKDPSFELKLAGDEGGWRLFEVSMYTDNQARSGDQSMFNAGLSRTIAYHPYFIGVVSGSYQEFPATPGSRWRLTGYGMAAAPLEGTPAFGIVQVSFFDADGKDLGTVETAKGTTKAKTSNEVNNQTPAGQWTRLDTGVATAPAGTATVQAFTIYVDFSGANLTQGVYFDDLSLCALDDNDDESGRCGQE